jgi:pyrimidine-nucleoside phosphorylase
MDQPLGRTAGNWLEVRESIACLEGNGPDDLQRLVIDCATHLLAQTGRAADVDAARQQALDCLASGAPRRKWNEMLEAQGTDLEAFERKLALGDTACVVVELKAENSGFVTRCDARAIGEIVRDLGGGRLTKESIIDPEVGMDQIVKIGEEISTNSVLARIHASNQRQADQAILRLANAISISDEPPAATALIEEIAGDVRI